MLLNSQVTKYQSMRLTPLLQVAKVAKKEKRERAREMFVSLH